MSNEMPGEHSAGVGGEGRRLIDEALDRGGEIGRQVKSEADHVMGEVRVRAREEGNEQAHRAAGALRGLAQQLGEMAEGTTGQGKVVDLTRQGAQQIERFADRLDREGMDGLLGDLQSFARRRPGAFLAAGFGLGMALGRLVRSADVGQGRGPDWSKESNTTPQYLPDSPAAAWQGPRSDNEFSPGRYESGTAMDPPREAEIDQTHNPDEIPVIGDRADDPANRMP